MIYVRGEGVKLERLLIERTVLAQGPLVVHDAGCVPIGKESMELDSDALINLGELRETARVGERWLHEAEERGDHLAVTTFRVGPLTTVYLADNRPDHARLRPVGRGG